MKQSKNEFLAWLVPGAMALALTGGFLLLIPATDRNARAEIPLPFVAAEREPAERPDPPVEPVQAPHAAHTVSAQPPAGGMYKWTDADGKVHYGDRPPEGTNAQAVDADRLNLSVVPMPSVPAPRPQPRATRPPAMYVEQPTQVYVAPQRTPRCKHVKDEIAWIDARMRQGYRVRYGEYLKEQRRELVKLRSQYCH